MKIQFFRGVKLPIPVVWLLTAMLIEMILAWIISNMLLYRQIDLNKEKRIQHLQKLDFIVLFAVLYTSAILLSDAAIAGILASYTTRIRLYVISYMIVILPVSFVLATLAVTKINRNKRDMLS